MVRKVLLSALFTLLVSAVAVQWFYIDYLKQRHEIRRQLSSHLHAIQMLQVAREAADRDNTTRNARRSMIIAQQLEIARLEQLSKDSGVALNDQARQILDRVERYRSPPEGTQLLAK
ncbi:MAG: hypothetical protein CTR55_04425 [Pseudomonas sp.]|uniref:hypothetical protein n=1 Tax=Pseudomonas sp. TaxID=306 RepID=UPI000CC4B9ED|nr:hypothetical protein [Pseudomonas sp.]PJI50586.1 MAG: hypothetical protein CTR55_04425 [Pseudomonas sp.]